MRARSAQVADETWVQFMYEYPGPVGVTAREAWDHALCVAEPEVLIVHARAYRRLVEHQDQPGMPAQEWLTFMHSALTEPADDGPSRVECFAAAVRALRGAKGLAQGDLADKAGVGVHTVSRVESDPEANRLRRSTMLAIADALNWDLDEMVELGAEVLAR